MAEDNKEGIIQKALHWAFSMDRDEMLGQHRGFVGKWPNKSRDELARMLTNRNAWLGAAIGFGSGLPANPWVMAPAAVADAGIVLRREVVLAARIGFLFDDAFLDDDEPPFELMIPVMGGHFASEAAKELAIRGGVGVTRMLIKKHLSKEALKAFKKVALKYFGLRVTQRAVITKSLPVIGGIIGGTWNYAEMQIIGNRAVHYFEGRPIQPAPDGEASVDRVG